MNIATIIFPKQNDCAAPHRGSKYILTHRTQGLRPELCRSIAPLGLIARPQQSIPPIPLNTTNNTITIKQKHERTQQSFDTPNTFNEHNTATQHRKRPIRQRALQGRHSCIAQGEMRAKPDMEPWVNADKSRLSSVGAALTHASKCPKG